MTDYITGITYDQIKGMYAQNGYFFHEIGKYNVNIGGLRNKDLVTVDKFNDYLFVAFMDEWQNKRLLLFAGTTKPGLAYLGETMLNPSGTGILIPGQYPNCWVIGTHNAGKPSAHEAFKQSGPKVFKVWRDKDKDGKLDFDGPVYDDVGGLDGHRGNIAETFNVGPHSAACQVWQDDKEHSIAVAVGKRCIEIYGKPLTYTLFQLQ